MLGRISQLTFIFFRGVAEPPTSHMIDANLIQFDSISFPLRHLEVVQKGMQVDCSKPGTCSKLSSAPGGVSGFALPEAVSNCGSCWKRGRTSQGDAAGFTRVTHILRRLLVSWDMSRDIVGITTDNQSIIVGCA